MNIVITGASRGLGKAIAEQFAGNGHNLYLCSRNKEALYKTVDEMVIRYPSITIKAKSFDLGAKDNARAFGDWIRDLGISIDVLINNAGQFLQGSIHNEQEGAIETMISVNLYSAYYVTKALLPKMMHQKSGHIFNICSVASLQGSAAGGSYSISKFALAGFSKNLREEMKPHGIKVTAVYPGSVFTDSWEGTGVDKSLILESGDVARMIYAASQLSPQATVEDIILRPQAGNA